MLAKDTNIKKKIEEYGNIILFTILYTILYVYVFQYVIVLDNFIIKIIVQQLEDNIYRAAITNNQLKLRQLLFSAKCADLLYVRYLYIPMYCLDIVCI